MHMYIQLSSTLFNHVIAPYIFLTLLESTFAPGQLKRNSYFYYYYFSSADNEKRSKICTHTWSNINKRNQRGRGMPGASSSLQFHHGVYVICITMNSTYPCTPFIPPLVVHCCKVYNFDSNSTKATGLLLKGEKLGARDWRTKVEALGERCISIGITIIVCSSHSNRSASTSPYPKNFPPTLYCFVLWLGNSCSSGAFPSSFSAAYFCMKMARADVECQ